MKSARRSILFGLLLAVLGGIGFTGCGDDSSTDPGPLSATKREAAQDSADGPSARGAHTTSND